MSSLAFVGGTALGAWLPHEPRAWGLAAAAVLALWAGMLAATRVRAATRSGITAFVVLGIFLIQRDLSPLYDGGDSPGEGDTVASGRVARPADRRAGETLLHLEEVRLRRGGETVRLSRPLQVSVAGGAPGCVVGDLIVARGLRRAIRGDRNFGWFPGPAAPRGRDYAARLAVASAAWVRRDGHDPGRGPRAAVLRWRAAADAFWKAQPGAAAQILNSLTTGERAGIPPETQEAFLRSGLTHLLAISGMNVGFLAALVFLVLRRGLALCEPLSLRFAVQPVAAALTLPALWFFMLFSGSQIPVGRAVLCGAAGLTAVMLWRRARPADVWAFAAAALVAWDPRLLFTAAFQLSFAAVGALMLVASRAPARPATPDQDGGQLRRLWRGARVLFVTSAAASLMTAPLVAFHFQQVSLVGPLANLAAVPYTGFVVLPAGWLTLLAHALCGPVAQPVARAALWSAGQLVTCAEWFAWPRWAAACTPRPAPLMTLSLLALAVALLHRPTPAWQGARCLACAAAAIAGSAWAIGTHPQELRLTVLDVGQGLACAAVLPGGGSLLFDAGPRWRDYDAGERVVVPALRRLGLTRLDTLAISHPHPDHEGGSAAVRRAFPVGQVWRGDGPAAMARSERRRLPGGVAVRVLNPQVAGDSRAAPAPDANDGSLALLLSWGETGVVLTGDVGATVAPGLVVAAQPSPRHIALQAPHHGGSPEACRTLAAGLRPEVSAISVGRNRYGHPQPAAIEELALAGRVLRTDRDGAVFIRCDGRQIVSRTWRAMAGGRTWAERMRWLVAGS